MTQPDTLVGLTRRMNRLETAVGDTADTLGLLRGEVQLFNRRHDRLEKAMSDQQTVLDGLVETVGNIARTQGEHTATLAEHGRRLDALDGKLDEILRRLPEPPSPTARMDA